MAGPRRVLSWRAKARRLLSFVHAATYELNPNNFENPWKAAYRTILEDAIKGRDSENAQVREEYDVFLQVTQQANVDVTIRLDRLTARSCRPDLVTGFYVLGEFEADGYPVKDFVVAVFVELKRAPSRREVSFRKGHPYSEQGVHAILRQLHKAQRQVENQASLYLQTRAGLTQDRVMLVAGAGRWMTFAVMYRRKAKRVAMDPWKLVQDLADEKIQDDLEDDMAWYGPGDLLPRGPRQRMPPPLHPMPSGGLQWSPIGKAHGSSLAGHLRDFLNDFERDYVRVKILENTVLRPLHHY
ncbi:hypothetical protein PENSPDRAFT_682129 [Peniophora sp. CONT]|nr:hypothetical protein PENSPDRAFT_682129 [Peniophora sp. CONT]